MRKWIGLGIVFLLVCLIPGKNAVRTSPALAHTVSATSLPLSFVPNCGQVSSEAVFYAVALDYALWLNADGITIDRPHDVSSMQFVGANPDVFLKGIDPNPSSVNFFLGDDPSEWKQDVPTYSSVLYQSLYPGIDLKVYQGKDGLEYDWQVKPGADILDICFMFNDVSESHLNQAGDLEVMTDSGLIRHVRPYSYQTIDGKNIEVESSFVEYEESTYGFLVPDYDPQHTLVIDPYLLVYSTLLGGSKNDGGLKVCVDKDRAVYVMSATKSPNFPTKNAFMPRRKGGWDIVITKISPDGQSIVYSSYYGGSDDDHGTGMTVDAFGAVYICGYSISKNLPIKNAYQGSSAGGREEAFFAKISPEGDRLLMSSYYGGQVWDRANDIEVDKNLNIYLAGNSNSPDLPLKNPIQGSLGGNHDVFVAKFTDFGEKLAFATFLGGVYSDEAYGLDLYKNNDIYITGKASSPDFPLKNPVQGVKAGSSDAFVAKINAATEKLQFSTFLGGNGIDWGQDIAVDKKGAAYVTGYTEAWDFPIKNQVFKNRPSTDAFVTKYKRNGSQIVYSTYIGGSYADWGWEIAVDRRGAAIIVGTTKSSVFPLKNALQTSWMGKSEVFITKIHPNGGRLKFSTYLGGSNTDDARTIAVDSKNAIYIAGTTYSNNFPTKNAMKDTLQGVSEAFVLKIK